MTDLVQGPHASGSASTESRRAATLDDKLGLLIDGATNYAIDMLAPPAAVRSGIGVPSGSRAGPRRRSWVSTSRFYPSEEVAARKPKHDLARADSQGRIEEERWRFRKDGSKFLASITVSALKEDAGAVIVEIMNAKAAETVLTRREQHLRSILATIPDAMIVIDEKGTITSNSAAAETRFGNPESEVIGTNVKVLMLARKARVY